MSNSSAAQKRRSILLVITFTLLSAVAQVLMKTGANRLAQFGISAQTVLLNAPLLAGLTLYGLGAVMMVLALRHGELSILYPMISLSYVWVAILSVLVFHEVMNSMRIAGICTIMAGVATLGRGSRS